jgi:hypothetical protein
VKDNQENDSQPRSGNMPLVMNRQQAEVFELLRGLAAERDKFHEWYQGAIQVLQSSSPDKIAQAANSIRELCDRLPNRIADIPEPKSPVPAVNSLQKEFLELKADGYGDGWLRKVINGKLNRLLLRLEEIFRLCNEPPRTSRFKLALTWSDPQAEFMSKEHRYARDKAFEEVGSFFQAVTHHKRIVDEFDFRKKLEFFESLLLNFLTPCTAAQQKELIALIEGPVRTETLAKINALISQKGANFVFFFERLDNPKWLQPLDQQGHFSNLPGPEPTKDGRVIYRIHVPLIALTKLSEKAPHEVTSILVKLKLPDNQRVGDQALQCLAKIRDVNCIRQLRPLIAQFGKSRLRTSWLWIEELLKTWIEAEAFTEVLLMIDICLVAAAESVNEGDSDTWRWKQIDKTALDRLMPKYPLEIAKSVFKALCRWANRERQKYGPTELTDDAPLSYWQEDFKSPPASHRGLEATLAMRLFAVAKQIYLEGDISQIGQLDILLRSNPWHLFKRLRWQLYADFPTFNLAHARIEVLNRMPTLNRIDYSQGSHDYEFAQLLFVHAREHGNAFLTPHEVEEFVRVVMTGPIDNEGRPVEDYKEVFCRKQLRPIAQLLCGKQLVAYRALVADDSKINLQSYKPYQFGGRSGEVISVAPPEADNLESMSERDLWAFLNTWKPKVDFPTPETWIQEDVSALATKFAELVENRPERFQPSTKWWENINRLEILNKVLDRAANRIAKKHNEAKDSTSPPKEEDWANWLGIAKWLMSVRMGEKTPAQNAWSRGNVAGFVGKVLETSESVPDYYFPEISGLLRHIIEADEPRLQGNQSAFGDWLSTAINTARGNATESLLNLALRQKNDGKDIDPWIFEFLRARLEHPQESPAVFALLGAKLRLLIHLFESNLKAMPTLLFPLDRPVHRTAAILAHFNYDHPWNRIILVFPGFINAALDTLEAMRVEAKDDDAKQNRRDFGSQLGTHIAFYYWNSSFATDHEGEVALDRFFAAATKSARATVISQIASIWENPSRETPDEKVIAKVMRIWERRFAQIVKKSESMNASTSDYDSELTESTDWLNCECLPFEWRAEHAMKAIARLKRAPGSYHLLKAIPEFGVMPDRLGAMLQLLRALLKKPSEELRWSIQFKELAPVISLGLASVDSDVKRLAEECRDLLLKMGFSDFLNLDGNQGK